MECLPDLLCVPTFFEGEPDGTHCLKPLVEPSDSCESPFVIETEPRHSVLGEGPYRFCGINEPIVSCDAVTSRLRLYCDFPCLADSRCEPIKGECLYRCDNSDECPSRTENIFGTTYFYPGVCRDWSQSVYKWCRYGPAQIVDPQ